jgi:hypothetical protein
LLGEHPKHKHFSSAILLDRAKGAEAKMLDADMIGSQLRFSFPVKNLASLTRHLDELYILKGNHPVRDVGAGTNGPQGYHLFTRRTEYAKQSWSLRDSYGYHCGLRLAAHPERQCMLSARRIQMVWTPPPGNGVA